MRYQKYASIGLLLALGGCGMPSGMAALSYVMNGVSYASSGKGVADHVLSAAVEEDCAMLRAAEGADICRSGKRGNVGDLMTMIDTGTKSTEGHQSVSSRKSSSSNNPHTQAAPTGAEIPVAAPLDYIYGDAR